MESSRYGKFLLLETFDLKTCLRSWGGQGVGLVLGALKRQICRWSWADELLYVLEILRHTPLVLQSLELVLLNRRIGRILTCGLLHIRALPQRCLKAAVLALSYKNDFRLALLMLNRGDTTHGYPLWLRQLILVPWEQLTSWFQHAPELLSAHIILLRREAHIEYIAWFLQLLIGACL